MREGIKEKVDELFDLLDQNIIKDRENRNLWTNTKIELGVRLLELFGSTIENIKITKMKIGELKDECRK